MEALYKIADHPRMKYTRAIFRKVLKTWRDVCLVEYEGLFAEESKPFIVQARDVGINKRMSSFDGALAEVLAEIVSRDLPSIIGR